jgi:hypothetical protein
MGVVGRIRSAGGRGRARQRMVVWMLAVPFMVAGTEVAHVVAYRLVYPDPLERAAVLSSTGHGYFAYTPLALAVGAALVGCALFARVYGARDGRHLRTLEVSPGMFAALPPATFALQEHLERLVHSGSWPFGAALEPTFLPGLALQLPFAFLVYLIARLLLRAAEKLGVALRSGRQGPRRRVAGLAVVHGRLVVGLLPRAAVPAGGRSVRGPPGARGESVSPFAQILRPATL